MKIQRHPYISHALFALVLLTLGVTLTACIGPAGRSQVRQETRVETRTENRMERRGW